MPNRNKLPFWQLSLIFGAITLLALGLSFGYEQEQKTGMMSDSMGNMMGSMHLQNVTINDLIQQQEQMEAATGQSQDHNSHHAETNSFLKTLHSLTIGTIVMLLPLILAGAVFLSIIWFGTTGKVGGRE